MVGKNLNKNGDAEIARKYNKFTTWNDFVI